MPDRPYRRQEAIAKWLNNWAVDWPPISYDWRGKDQQSVVRRKAMRLAARELMDLYERT